MSMYERQMAVNLAPPAAAFTAVFTNRDVTIEPNQSQTERHYHKPPCAK